MTHQKMSPLTKLSYDYIQWQRKHYLTVDERLALWTCPKNYNLFTKEGRRNAKNDIKYGNKVFKRELLKIIIEHTYKRIIGG